jgi:Glycosyltransferase family 87
MTAVASVGLGPGTRLTALVRIVLGAVAVAVFVNSAIPILTRFPVALDAVIPLNAAERWLDGGAIYVADGFADLNLLPPFLYPPFIVPLFAPLTFLPEIAVRWAFVAVLLVLAVLTCRRLAIPWALVPFVLLWTPMLGGIWAGNIALAMFAAFIAAFWRTPQRHELEPEPRDLDGREPPDARIGWLAASVAAIKVSQAQAWLAILRRSPRAALLGAVPWIVLVLVTLPLVGITAYGAWLDQLARASDPTWEAMGPSLLQVIPGGLFAALTLASFAAAVLLRGRDTGVWLGILMLVVTPNMHVHSALFLMPALLRIRREFALLGAMLTATLTDAGFWLGIVIVVGVMLAGERWSVLREPSAADVAVG